MAEVVDVRKGNAPPASNVGDANVVSGALSDWLQVPPASGEAVRGYRHIQLVLKLELREQLRNLGQRLDLIPEEGAELEFFLEPVNERSIAKRVAFVD